MNEKKLIVSLIKDNLINTRLILGLNRLDLSASNYYLGLPDVILQLMNLQIPDEDLGAYIELFNEVDGIDISMEPERLNLLTEKIYKVLLEWNN